MQMASHETMIFILLHILVQIFFVVRVMLRPHRQPASRIAWLVVVLAFPILGILLYLFFGEVNIGRKRVNRLRNVLKNMGVFPTPLSEGRRNHQSNIPLKYHALFNVGKSISHFEAVAGNSAQLMANSNAAIDAMVADIDMAEHHVHVLFYIWLSDSNGLKIVSALKRAAARGVKCRAMVDDLGSRAMVHSKHWQEMSDAGVHTATALSINFPLLRAITGRIDLRNHRKIVVIDTKITYCGSQNCADPEFLVKAKYAPWVDVMMRFEGPIVVQNQYVFSSDWMTYVDENLNDLLNKPIHLPDSDSGFTAQVVATGPTARYSAMPEMFESLMYAARHELVITTPYYVPDEAMQNALCSVAYRGVDTSIIFPARNDSWMVAAASRSYYAELLKAGVKIYEYEGGLLHAKTLTLDGDIVLIGSANMDRRSFELNYENNILLYNAELYTELRQRQQEYMNQSLRVYSDEVNAWSMSHRFLNNTMAMLGPLF